MDRQRARSVETQLRQASIASRLFDEDALVKVGRFTILERLGMGAMGAVYRAYDPSLDRAIALKVLHPDAIAMADEAEGTMRQEAKALAQLSHPNVVTVHEVGGEASQIWIAMEFVEGGDLARRLADLDDVARFDTVIDMMLQAGEGLHAAHGAGVIHRDFKPANVLVGTDDRVRVADFGLARRASGDDDATVGVGTPAYMPPEQWDEQVDARADQYAYCVVLWEALFGDRPDRLGAEIKAPDGADPRAVSLVSVLRRGLQEGREDRFPDMGALLEAIREVAFDRPRRRQRQRRTAGVIVALLGTGSVALWQSSRAAEDPCSGAAERLEAFWAEDNREDAFAQLAGLGLPYAERAVPRIRAAAERFSDDWATAYRTTCIAHTRKEQSDYVFERRMSCLDQAGAAFTALADQAATAAPEVSALVRAAAGLPQPQACTTLQALPEAARPPERIQGEIDAIDTLLTRSRTYLDAGAPSRALELVDDALAAARKLDFGPATARALHARGRIRALAGPIPGLSTEDAIADLAEASDLALRERTYVLAVEAWSRQAWLVGTHTPGRDVMLSQSNSWTALVGGAAPGSAQEALLHNNLGSLHLVGNDRVQARKAFHRSVEIAEALPFPDRELDNAAINLALLTDDNADRDALFERIVQQQRTLLGDEHPQVLQLELLFAVTTASPDVARATLVRLVETYRRFHPDLSKPLFEAHLELAWRLLARGNASADAARHFAAAEALCDWDETTRDLAGAFASLAGGDHDAARARFDAVAKTTAVTPWQHENLAHAELGLAVLARDAEHFNAATAAFAEFDALPTAVLVARIEWAIRALEDGPPGLTRAVDRWRSGAGTRRDLETALQKL